MSEHHLLDLLAQEAPAPSPRLAEDVIRRAHHVRRRRWALTGTCGVIVAVAALSLALSADHTPARHRIAPAGPTASSSPILTDPRSTEAAIYAAALTGRPRPDAGSGDDTVLVLEHTCDNVIAANVGPCHAQAISADVQRDVPALLAPRVIVRFGSTADLAQATGERVTLGRIRMVGGGAHVPIEVQCGPLCGQGQTLVLKQVHAGVWTVTGTTGPEWIN